VEIFEIIPKKRGFSDGCFPHKKHIPRHKSHHGDIEIGEVICDKNIGFTLLDFCPFFNFDRKENEREIDSGPITLHFSAKFFPARNPNTNK
jgi:hypothetical protein